MSSNIKNKISILIVEDESVVALEIEDFMRSKGFSIVDVVDNYDDAMTAIENKQVDILLCDINIKGIKNGIELVRDIKRKQETNVIYLTAFADEKTISEAIDTEPCGYLTKPFKREELYAAVQLASRKEHNFSLDHGYVYSIKTEQLFHDNDLITLSKKEHTLLKLLIKQNGKVLTTQHMEHEIWPNNSVSDSARRTLIYRLNHKLKYQIINTIPGIGYQLSIYSKIK